MKLPTFNPAHDGNPFDWIIRTSDEVRKQPRDFDQAKFLEAIEVAKRKRDSAFNRSLQLLREDKRGMRETGFKSTAD